GNGSGYESRLRAGPMERRETAARGRGSLISPSPAAFAERNRSDRRFLNRTFCLQRVRHERTSRVRDSDQVPELPSLRAIPRVGTHLHPNSVPRALRNLHLVPWGIERHLLPLGRQLALHRAALDRHHRLRLYTPARLQLAIYRSSPR